MRSVGPADGVIQRLQEGVKTLIVQDKNIRAAFDNLVADLQRLVNKDIGPDEALEFWTITYLLQSVNKELTPGFHRNAISQSLDRFTGLLHMHLKPYTKARQRSSATSSPGSSPQ